MSDSPGARRNFTRYGLETSVTVNGQTADSRNISARGIYLVTDGDFFKGSKVDLSIFLPKMPQKSLHLLGSGTVVRIQREKSRLGVAVALDDWWRTKPVGA